MTKGKSFDPFAAGTAEELADLLLLMSDDEMGENERNHLASEVHAIVGALVELRDAGFLQLNAHVMDEHSTFEGLRRLSTDSRLSENARAQCRSVRQRTIIEAVHDRWASPKS